MSGVRVPLPPPTIPASDFLRLFVFMQQFLAHFLPKSLLGKVPKMYEMTDTDRNLRLANFVLCIISTVCACWTIIALAWMIPMTVHSYGIYKGEKPNTVAFGVCTLIFVSLIGGILLLCSNKDE